MDLQGLLLLGGHFASASAGAALFLHPGPGLCDEIVALASPPACFIELTHLRMAFSMDQRYDSSAFVYGMTS